MTHYVAPEEPEPQAASLAERPAKGYWGETWSQLRRSTKFWVSAAVLLFVLALVAAPDFFSGTDPRSCDLEQSKSPPSAAHPFGVDFQGCDIYSRTVHGARASVEVGVGTALAVFLVGGFVGVLAGYFGGWADGVLSRASEIFAGVPLILAAVVLLKILPQRGVFTIIAILAVFSWPQIARVARAAAAMARSKDYVLAARSLGVSTPKILLRHILPNSLGPIIATTTISLGVFIVAESTLSYMGIGLPPSVVSWGADISSGQARLLEGSAMMFYPAAALGTTVLAFILLGDALRDATDPKARRR
ncbi:binding-protein-dependent transport systems inner membrane component [Segniliparus rotundus DSM 44985]|uniref:Binding-protein-dependent transport systems inner membrane component n=1 Tax=Segniliparus rotundus (strain ATCC BAA-972 / CDC 1076 / CIP 108378 / DSM 44985 / JCM 13578) TaxID=640132 RepID=D6ZF70_SEGRD|nr:ABC transporter permease [Segniliparus rotundus]ADG97594.1 binding-protein-dependent transport systems inner membrane component [Segniliparus rotundus DSM 44985]